MLCVGVYNGGMMGVGRGTDGIRFHGSGMAGLGPLFFKGVQISRAPGRNLGHQRACSERDFALDLAGRLTFCDEPVTVMGGGPTKDKKFVQKIMPPLTDGATELQIVNDKFGSLTYTRDFAHNVRSLLEKEYWGIYNMPCDGLTSRLEIARALLECRGSQDRVRNTEVSGRRQMVMQIGSAPHNEHGPAIFSPVQYWTIQPHREQTLRQCGGIPFRDQDND